MMDNKSLLLSNVHPIAEVTNQFLLTCHWKKNCMLELTDERGVKDQLDWHPISSPRTLS